MELNLLPCHMPVRQAVSLEVIVGTVMASAAKLVSSKDPWDMATLAARPKPVLISWSVSSV